MKKLNPFNGPGLLPAEHQQKRRGQFKIMVWTIVTANALLFAGMLIQGCRGEPTAAESSGGPSPEVAAFDTNSAAAVSPQPETNSAPAMAAQVPPTNSLPEGIPSLAPAPAPGATKSYTVAKGDSFYKIAKANGISVKALTAANPGVDSAKLKVGQPLQLPPGPEPSSALSAAPPAAAQPPVPPKSPTATRYVVKSHDTLARIARAHGTTVAALKAANGLTSDHIVAGQSLKLTAGASVRVPTSLSMAGR